MVKNPKAKGWRTVRDGREILHSMGYITDTLERGGKFRKDKDLFGLWDLLAIKKRQYLFIQFKTNKKGKAWMKPYQKFADTHKSNCVSYEIWNKFDRKGFTRVIL